MVDVFGLIFDSNAIISRFSCLVSPEANINRA